MPYVRRDEDGKIVALLDRPEPGADEQKSIMDEEVKSFLVTGSDAARWVELLSASDAGIIRILEDLIDLLIRKNIISFTELPYEAQEKINERKQQREQMISNHLVVDDII